MNRVAAVASMFLFAHAAACGSAVNEPRSSTAGALTHAAVPTVALPAEIIRSDKPADDGCWARLFKRAKFKGDSLTLLGPVAAPNVWTGGGYAWEPEYDSIEVGPTATLILYDHRNFRDSTATFDHAQSVPNLDSVMGVFRTIRSLKVSCSGNRASRVSQASRSRN